MTRFHCQTVPGAVAPGGLVQLLGTNLCGSAPRSLPTWTKHCHAFLATKLANFGHGLPRGPRPPAIADEFLAYPGAGQLNRHTY